MASEILPFVTNADAVMIFLAPWLLTLGLMQLIAAFMDLRGVSLTGSRRWLGYLVGVALFAAGAYLLPPTPLVFGMILPASALALASLLAVSSLIGRHLDPTRFLRPGDWPAGHCQAVRIPNGERVIPGLLITPPAPTAAAVCLIHGSGDNKTAFKWRLIGALLSRGLTVLTIDLAGHGENRTPQRWPDCTTEIPAALAWLRDRPGVEHVGLLGISMGGALSAHAAVTARPDALALCETPIAFHYTRRMVRREVWHTLRSPVLDLMRETTAWQIWQTWHAGQGKREIALSDLIQRLDVPGHIARVSCPLHLVYGQRDGIAPLRHHGQYLYQVATGPSQLTIVPGASHLTLILLPQTTHTLADWFAEYLIGGKRQENVSF
jgi:pimeloyl-ACP methyl ester carboxylesterase